jgi:hypothetical protein
MVRLLLVTVVVAVASPLPVHGQQARLLSPLAGLVPQPRARPATPLSSTIPDSVRQKSGYHHWTGAAIGAGVGALGGLALAVAAHGQCADCPSDSPSIGKVTVLGAGLGGAFGFLVGLATPRYRWVPAERP